MNPATEEQTIELLDIEPVKHNAPALQGSREVAAPAGPLGNAMAFLQSGGDLAMLEKMMDLQERFDAKQSEKAFNEAFAAFKAEAVRIVKGTAVNDGPLKGKAYANLADVVLAITPALSKHGLSASWKLTKDEPQWMEITCTLKHVGGHSESVSMGGEPDNGPGRNKIQARASTKSYLERYTLLAITGMAASDADNDGGSGAPDGNNLRAEWIQRVAGTKTAEELQSISRQGAKVFQARKDRDSYAAFATAVQIHGADLKKATA